MPTISGKERIGKDRKGRRGKGNEMGGKKRKCGKLNATLERIITEQNNFRSLEFGRHFPPLGGRAPNGTGDVYAVTLLPPCILPQKSDIFRSPA